MSWRGSRLVWNQSSALSEKSPRALMFTLSARISPETVMLPLLLTIVTSPTSLMMSPTM